jgi:hypothetical protein
MFQGFSTDTSVGLTLLLLFAFSVVSLFFNAKLYVDKQLLIDKLTGRKPRKQNCESAPAAKLVTLRNGI